MGQEIKEGERKEERGRKKESERERGGDRMREREGRREIEREAVRERERRREGGGERENGGALLHQAGLDLALTEQTDLATWETQEHANVTSLCEHFEKGLAPRELTPVGTPLRVLSLHPLPPAAKTCLPPGWLWVAMPLDVSGLSVS